MGQVSVEELHEHTYEVIDRVANGEEIVVTVDGVPTVVLKPIPPSKRIL